ncbi:ATP-binding protein [Streptomyces sp. GZWMJZ-114]|uniref:SCO6881 family protein n=1 Tax=Streptomyces sp. GZWMJZ-114 TaxID=2494734 RepID=UPI0010132823|nr:ATP-binding protein [Streptomyces sp. GZWMJZ-114]
MGFCDLPLADKVCSVGDAASFAADPGKAIGNWIAASAGELATTCANLASRAVDSTTAVDLSAGWFRDNYETVLPIALVIMVATFCAQLVRAALRRDGQALTQALTGTVGGILFAFTAIALTTIALDVVDALSAGLFKSAGLNISSAVRRLVKVDELLGLSPLGWLVSTVAALAMAVGAVLFWCVMMVRKVGILVLVTLAPFAGAGGGWEAARRWRRGWIEATATLVVSKLLMTIIFVLGISALGRTQAKDGLAALTDILAGTIIMALILLTPYAAFKFVHWAAEGADSETLHRAGGAGAQMARQHAERAGRKAAAAAATAATGGAAAAAGAEGVAAQGPDALPGGQGFPGDIAPTSPSQDGGESQPVAQQTAQSMLDKLMQVPPTHVDEDPDGQPGSTPSSSDPAQPAEEAASGGWRSTSPTTSAPPAQGTTTANDTTTAAGPPGTPPPSTGI